MTLFPKTKLLLFNWRLLALATLLTGCLTSGSKEERRKVNLADTDLVGQYVLVDYLIEYGDGQTLNPAILKLEGRLTIDSDSGYLERISVDSAPPSDTKGKITQILLFGSGKTRGEVTLTLEQADSTSTSTGSSTFAFHGDTLILITTVSKEKDKLKKGFKETDYWIRDLLRTL